MDDIDAHLAPDPVPLQGRAQLADLPHGGRAPGRRHPRDPGRAAPRRAADDRRARRALPRPGRPGWTTWDIRCGTASADARSSCSTPPPAGCAPPRRSPRPTAGRPWTPTPRPAASATSSTPTPPTAASPSCAATWRRDGCIVKTAGVPESIWHFRGPALVCESQEEAVEAILGKRIVSRRRGRHPLRGPRGGPGMQEMLYPTSYLKGAGPGHGVRADHRRPLLRRHLGPVDRPRLPRGGGRRGRSAWSRTAT